MTSAPLRPSRAFPSCAIMLLAVAALVLPAGAQDEDGAWTDETFAGLELRALGPAFMSGRIADLAIDPRDESLWYVAVGSGGVWKTENAGVTWTPVFDEQSSYSIGCVTIDPHHPHRVWVGTGENVGGRHVGFGDGVHRSDDAGQSWTKLGLEQSEHIAEIVVHPEDPDVVWVAAQGPLWTPGGERGVYRSEDGGATWTRTLGDDEWVGATELVLDPSNPDRLYAATWQRHRSVAAYLGGGPGSGLHRSDDGGRTWRRLEEGLPEGPMGKIGLALCPFDPDTVYAAIELNRRAGGVYRSTDRGATWEKRSDAVSGGTGPHYYQELYAHPHHRGRIYLADVRIQVSHDGGATFTRLKEEHKHSDNHAMAFKASDPDFLLVGTDGGLYESHDDAEHWRYFANLPLTQYYKIALDDAEPFYNVYGGTQDNATQGGPVRTDNVHGIRNADWRVVLDWDGHQPATEPGNPDILYAERQEGFLARIDARTGEVMDIQPQRFEDEGVERFNWDSPILVSPHQPTRLYFASQRVWCSEDRGDSWTAVSGDLTRNEERLSLPIGGGSQSWDNAWDVNAMSNYNTITSLSESPVEEGLLYAGTDDGFVGVRDGAGSDWRRVPLGSLPGVAERAFVNDLKADLHDADRVYLVLDDHKGGDFSPYVFVSADRGRSWSRITDGLPERTLVWRIVPDSVRPELLFLGTEFGLYFSVDAGDSWSRLKGGLPTIALRDLALHRRDDDLVAASFGRGIFVLDDIGPFREISREQMRREATLFSVRKAWWYVPRPVLSFEPGVGDQGAGHFMAPNPPFGAVFSYHLREDLPRREKTRRRAEEADPSSARFPGWEAVERERREAEPRIWLSVRDAAGEVVRRVPGPTTAGFHRVAWDLRRPAYDAIERVPGPPPMWGGPPRGLMVAPGTYTVRLSKVVDGAVTLLSEERSFEVVPLREGSLPGAAPEAVAAFWRRYEDAARIHSAMQLDLSRALEEVKRAAVMLARSRTAPGPFDERLEGLRQRFLGLDAQLSGHASRRQVGEKNPPTIADRLNSVMLGVGNSTHGPTATHERSMAAAETEITRLHGVLKDLRAEFARLRSELVEAGAPWLEGGSLPGGDR